MQDKNGLQLFKFLLSVVEKSLRNVVWFVVSRRNHLTIFSWCSKSNCMFEQRYFVNYLTKIQQNLRDSAPLN